MNQSVEWQYLPTYEFLHLYLSTVYILERITEALGLCGAIGHIQKSPLNTKALLCLVSRESISLLHIRAFAFHPRLPPHLSFTLPITLKLRICCDFLHLICLSMREHLHNIYTRISDMQPNRQAPSVCPV